MDSPLPDCLIIGAGPAGLTAALYLARFQRRVLVVDAGDPRAAWIPSSHNIAFFEHGIAGTALLARARAHVERYGTPILAGTAERLEKHRDRFVATVRAAGGAVRQVAARRVLLATGAADVEPALPDLPDAVRRGLVRYCPICDGFESRGKRIAVIGRDRHALAEAVFIARTYSSDVTMLSLGQPLQLDRDGRERAAAHGITLQEQAVDGLTVQGNRIAALHAGGAEHRFEVLYSALGLVYHSGLAERLGAVRHESGALEVDEHNQTTVKGLYAAGDVARGLDQIAVAMAHAATAATHIHNRCELPTEDEPGAADRRQ